MNMKTNETGDSDGDHLSNSSSDSLRPSLRFPKKMRLLKSEQFLRVYKNNEAVSNVTLVVLAAENDRDFPRLGLNVSRKVGNAVIRARWKRLIRESFRLSQHELPHLDLIVRPRRGANPDFEQIRASLLYLANKAGKRLQKKTNVKKSES